MEDSDHDESHLTDESGEEDIDDVYGINKLNEGKNLKNAPNNNIHNRNNLKEQKHVSFNNKQSQPQTR